MGGLNYLATVAPMQWNEELVGLMRLNVANASHASGLFYILLGRLVSSHGDIQFRDASV